MRPANTVPSMPCKAWVFLRRASRVEPSSRAISGKCARTRAQSSSPGQVGSGCACSVHRPGKELAQGRRRQGVQSFGNGLLTDLERPDPQQALAGQDPLHFGHGTQPPPHQAHNNRYHHGQGQQPGPQTDQALGIVGVAALQPSRSQQRGIEQGP